MSNVILNVYITVCYDIKNFQPYTMRICVLSVLKELIIHVLSHDELTPEEEKTRDNYFSILQDHLLDINAFVRCKVCA